MPINKRKILKAAHDEIEKSKRERVSLYLNKSLYTKFKAACDRAGIPASTIVEKLMEEFISS